MCLSCLFQNTLNDYNKAALAEAVFDAQNEMSFNEGKN